MTKDTRTRRDPEGVRRDILRIATEMFARHGLAGSRIDEIAAQTRTSKRMIYYYFTDKVGLYVACLEAAYARLRDNEARLDLADLPPLAALARLIGFTFDHHRANPDFIRLVMVENTHDARHLRASQAIAGMNRPAIDTLCAIIARGEAAGVMRAGLDPVALHWQISSMCLFNVANRPTFSTIYGADLFTEAGQACLRQMVIDTVLCHVREGSTGQGGPL